MNINNIKINKYNIDYQNTKFKDLINENLHLLPNLNKKSIEFDIINSNEAFANALRRVFNDELLIKCLTANIHNLNTDDKYILPDNIIERINLISVDQNINEDVVFNLSVVNNTNDIVNVYTRDLINKNKNDKNIYFNNNMQICTLKPNKFLNINNIYINKDFGYNNSLYTLGTFRYNVINTDFNIPSLNNTITDFNIEFINNANIKLDDIVKKIYDTLYFRLKKIQTSINEYDINSNSNEIHKINNELFIINNNTMQNTNILDSENITSVSDNNIFEIHINNEYHTIGNLITKYVYLLDNNIELVNYKLIHPLTHKIIITIKHSNFKKVINDSINNIIKDLDIFKSTLIKFISKKE